MSSISSSSSSQSPNTPAPGVQANRNFTVKNWERLDGASYRYWRAKSSTARTKTRSDSQLRFTIHKKRSNSPSPAMTPHLHVELGSLLKKRKLSRSPTLRPTSSSRNSSDAILSQRTQANITKKSHHRASRLQISSSKARGFEDAAKSAALKYDLSEWCNWLGDNGISSTIIRDTTAKKARRHRPYPILIPKGRLVEDEIVSAALKFGFEEWCQWLSERGIAMERGLDKVTQ